MKCQFAMTLKVTMLSRIQLLSLSPCTAQEKGWIGFRVQVLGLESESPREAVHAHFQVFKVSGEEYMAIVVNAKRHIPKQRKHKPGFQAPARSRSK